MAGGDDLKLVGAWASPFVARVKLALTLKGLNYHDVQEVEDLSTKSELLLASNPVYKKVPVFIHNGKPFCESLVIVQYIDEVWASNRHPILPADPNERAVARFWAAYVDDKLVTPLVNALSGKTEEEKAEGKKQMADAVETLERALWECSKGKGFFAGDSPGLMDISLGCLLSWLGVAELMFGAKIFDPVKTPLLVAWKERFGELDAAKEVLPEVQKVVEFAMRRQAAAAAAAADNNSLRSKL